MKRRLIYSLAIIASLTFVGEAFPPLPVTGQAWGAQSTAKKSSATKTTKKKKQTSKRSYCGYPSPPIPAGMSDFCAMQYDLYCRRGVGCNIYGR